MVNKCRLPFADIGNGSLKSTLSLRKGKIGGTSFPGSTFMNFGLRYWHEPHELWRLLLVHGWNVNSEFWRNELYVPFLDGRDSQAVLECRKNDLSLLPLKMYQPLNSPSQVDIFCCIWIGTIRFATLQFWTNGFCHTGIEHFSNLWPPWILIQKYVSPVAQCFNNCCCFLLHGMMTKFTFTECSWEECNRTLFVTKSSS